MAIRNDYDVWGNVDLFMTPRAISQTTARKPVLEVTNRAGPRLITAIMANVRAEKVFEQSNLTKVTSVHVLAHGWLQVTLKPHNPPLDETLIVEMGRPSRATITEWHPAFALSNHEGAYSRTPSISLGLRTGRESYDNAELPEQPRRPISSGSFS